MEIWYIYVAKNIGRDGNMPGDGFSTTLYWGFKENWEGDEVVDESVGQTFGGELLRDPIVSENEIPCKDDMVTPIANHTYFCIL